MSNADALMRITGIPDLPAPTKLAAIAAMHDATKLRSPLVGRFVLRATIEDARLIRRDELIEEYRSLGLFSVARALLKRPQSEHELLVVACGDDGNGVHFRTVPMSLLRAIFPSARPAR
jgi:hypothetical protein